MKTRRIWLAAALLAIVCLLCVATRNRWWHRIEDVEVFVDGNRVTTLRTYQGRSGRILVISNGLALLSDDTRSSMGTPQGGSWITTGIVCMGVHADAMLVPVGKSDFAWKEVAIRGTALKNGQIMARVPTTLLEISRSGLR